MNARKTRIPFFGVSITTRIGFFSVGIAYKRLKESMPTLIATVVLGKKLSVKIKRMTSYSDTQKPHEGNAASYN